MSCGRKPKPFDTELIFSKIHIPKMRSIFWKYFGFPTNDHDEIITKQKIVCTLCNTILRNHFNTTNIRAHIQSTHKVLFADLIATHGIKIPPRKNQSRAKTRQKHNSSRTAKRLEASFSSNTTMVDEVAINMMEGTPLTYEDTDCISKNEVLSEDVLLNNLLEQTSSEIVSPGKSDGRPICLEPLNISFDITPIQMQSEYDVEEALKQMIVKDLQNVSSIYSFGMQEFITGFLSNQILPPIEKIESSIKKLHANKFVKLRDRIKVHSQVKLYSLSFDIWENIESKQFVSIYFNNISEEFENRFCNNLYRTVELNNYTMFDQIFEEFNLENCSAAVVNGNDENLNTFLSTNDIPIMHCFSYIVNTCIDDVFRIPAVSTILEEVEDVITRYAPEICVEDVEIPVICNKFPLTRLALLTFFCENVSWPDDVDLLISKAKRILETITPLEVTLNTLKEEDIPLSSLFVPFAHKIIKKHFVISQYDDAIVQEIKTRIIGEFQRSVCSNNHLVVTAMLDPRFHKFLSIKNVSISLNILEKKYAQLTRQRGVPKCEIIKEESPKTSKKTHLKMFFDCIDEPMKNVGSEAYVEIDLRRYREEAFASLEESPLLWWNQHGHMYGSLRILADAYNCILGFVNISHKNSLKDQISFHRKRFMLVGKLIDPILFLNKSY